MHQLTPERQFAALLSRDGAQPFVTYYDEATGQRSELSVRSTANWVAKTHHLLGDELGLGVGDTALIALPAHWISVPIVLGCLTAGLSLTPSGAADVGFVAPDSVAAAGDIPDVYAIAPASLTAGGTPPEGTQDYVTAVRPQADAWPGVAMPAGPDDACLPGLTRTQVADPARALPAAARLLTTRDWHGADDWLATLFAPLAAGGSVVFVRNTADEDVLARRFEQERATVRD